MGNSTSKGKSKHWPLKIFFITLLISGSISFVAEVFMDRLSIFWAVVILILLIGIGVLFDIIGVAFASCQETPFISMSAKKIKKAKVALNMLKKADMVSNFCNDVVGDVCGIISGAAGAAISYKIVIDGGETADLIVGIAISALVAALTVSGKALGKKVAMNKNKEIVELIGAIVGFFKRNKDGAK